MLHDISETAANAFTLGAGDWLSSKLPGAPSLSQIQGETEASRERVPWYVRTPIEVAAYGAGPGKALGALAGGSVLGEGALAGGLSGGFSSDFDPMRTAGNATVGAGLGALSGLIPKGVNAGLTKALGKEGTVDPAAAIASTAKDTADAYAALHQKEVSPFSVNTALIKGRYNLSPSEETGLSGGFKSQFNDINKANDSLTLSGGKPTAGDVDSWQRQIQDAAVSSTDKIAAGKIRDNLTDVLKQHDAYGLQQDAKAAYQKSKMAENLAEWQRKVSAGGSAGQAPFTEAENWYQNDPAKYETLVKLANQPDQSRATWALGHLGAHTLGMGGYALGGVPGSLGGEALGYLWLKPQIAKLMKSVDARAKLRGYQQAYPQFTGVQPKGAVQAPQLPPQAGDLLKNLMLGGAY
jgi:hypothetical protein